MQAVLKDAARIVLATHNRGKLGEFRDLFVPRGLAVVSIGELGLPEPEETGTTFEENADLKSRAALDVTGEPCLADDSGICVDALGGRPGVYTADWAGSPRDYGAAMRRVEDELALAAAAGDPSRRARFVSVLSLALPDGTVRRFRGEVEGTLVWPPRGGHGFGFDPMFVPDGHDRTFAEMTLDEKQGTRGGEPLSHRARSIAAFLDAVG